MRDAAVRVDAAALRGERDGGEEGQEAGERRPPEASGARGGETVGGVAQIRASEIATTAFRCPNPSST